MDYILNDHLVSHWAMRLIETLGTIQTGKYIFWMCLQGTRLEKDLSQLLREKHLSSLFFLLVDRLRTRLGLPKASKASISFKGFCAS